MVSTPSTEFNSPARLARVGLGRSARCADTARPHPRQSRYVCELLGEVDADPEASPTIEMLDMFGRMERFFCLEQLADDPQSVGHTAKSLNLDRMTKQVGSTPTAELNWRGTNHE